MIDIKKNILLKNHTTFKIGGPAKFFVKVDDELALRQAINFAKKAKIPWFLLGNGSNILIADRGFNGLVIKNNLNRIAFRIDHKLGIFTAGSGVQLNELIAYTLEKGYTGLHHFAYIPGTVGGAVYINAHYLHYFMADFICSGKVMDQDGVTHMWQKSDFKFGYDSSELKHKQMILLQASFRLKPGDTTKAKEDMRSILVRRKKYPPLSAGCIWQNLTVQEQKSACVEQGAVGFLIDHKLGLKGKKINQAQISLSHAAFIENLGGAKAQDVLALIRLVKDKVRQKYDLNLRLEIDLLGFTKPELKGIIN